MATKTRSLSFRVPAKIRDAIQAGKKRTGESQSDYIVSSVKELIATMKNMKSIDDLLLPDGYEIPTQDSKMVTIRISPLVPDKIKAIAPRLYHSSARLILWAIEHRSRRLDQEPSEKE